MAKVFNAEPKRMLPGTVKMWKNAGRCKIKARRAGYGHYQGSFCCQQGPAVRPLRGCRPRRQWPGSAPIPGVNLKILLLVTLLGFSGNAMAQWAEYATAANGDVFYFDDARVQKDGNLVSVWNRIQYKTSVMGASSYQSLMNIDCSEHSETTLQSTFYTDKNWTTPAMATNTKKKPKRSIKENSATRRLATILCQQ
jgi:hypothetical protein